MNKAPIIKVQNVNQNNGTELEPGFKFEVSLVIDEDLPLSYEFFNDEWFTSHIMTTNVFTSQIIKQIS